jgi:hypothetical protein
MNDNDPKWVEVIPVEGEKAPGGCESKWTGRFWIKLGQYVFDAHTVAIWNQGKVRFRKPAPVNMEMPIQEWLKLSLVRRAELNTPADEAARDGKVTQYWYGEGWDDTTSIDVTFPHRVEPADPPKPRTFYANDYGDHVSRCYLTKADAITGCLGQPSKIIKLVEVIEDNHAIRDKKGGE